LVNDPGLSSAGALTPVSGGNTAWQLGTVMVSTSRNIPNTRLSSVGMTTIRENDLPARVVPNRTPATQALSCPIMTDLRPPRIVRVLLRLLDAAHRLLRS
jgi:hypothetical protein